MCVYQKYMKSKSLYIIPFEQAEFTISTIFCTMIFHLHSFLDPGLFITRNLDPIESKSLKLQLFMLQSTKEIIVQYVYLPVRPYLGSLPDSSLPLSRVLLEGTSSW